MPQPITDIPVVYKNMLPLNNDKGNYRRLLGNNKGNISSAKGHQPAMKTVAYSNVSGLAVMTRLRRIKIMVVTF
jgi:hypothetical protein